MDKPLDDTAGMADLDKTGMLETLENFPGQCREGIAAGNRIQLPGKPAGKPRRLFIVGMGGSAVGGDLLGAYLYHRSPVPVEVIRDYRLPRYAGREDVVIASSYSGDTEEALAGLDEALERGIYTVCLTTGGRLAAIAGEKGIPLVRIPPTIQPRAALGPFFFLLLKLAEIFGLHKTDPGETSETIELLERSVAEFGGDRPTDTNPAKRLAHSLHGRYPVIYTSDKPFGPVGNRWKCQFNENSKTAAHHNVIPEMCHNEIEAIPFPPEFAPLALAVFLEDRGDHPRIRRRFEIVKEILYDNNLESVSVFALGRELMARIFYLILLGDFVSFYLAILNNIDPTPIANIDRLKSLLNSNGTRDKGVN